MPTFFFSFFGPQLGRFLAVAAVCATLGACGGGSSGGSAGTSLAPALSTITPSSSETVAGGASVTLTSSGSPSSAWTLSGPGTIASNGNSATYTPPAQLAADTTVTITATDGSTTQAHQLRVHCHCSPALLLSAGAAYAVAGGRDVTLTAKKHNLSGTVAWTLEGPGSLNASTGDSVSYIPPGKGTVGADTSVKATAHLGDVTSEMTLSLHAAMRTTWTYKDLGTLGGTIATNQNGEPTSAAAAVNDVGEVVGYSLLADNKSTHAFLYRNGTMTDLTPNFYFSMAVGINNSGVIIGNYAKTATSKIRAFTYSNGTLTDLIPDVDTSSARAINNKCQVIGSIGNGNDSYDFFFNDGTVTRLPQGFQVQGLDNLGRMVGSAHFDGINAISHAALYADGKLVDLTPEVTNDPFDIFGTSARASSINSAGQIGVTIFPVGGRISHSFILQNGIRTPIDVENSRQLQLNEKGEATMETRKGADPVTSGYFYANGKAVTLNSLSAGPPLSCVLSTGYVNNVGMIAGETRNFTSDATSCMGAYLLLPPDQ